jgi:hypothetical protein
VLAATHQWLLLLASRQFRLFRQLALVHIQLTLKRLLRSTGTGN